MSTKNIETLMQVTSFKSWMILWAIAVVLAGVIVWSVIGSLPERVEGRGKVQTVAGTQEITSPDFGILQELVVKDGDTVKVGQVVGRVKSKPRDLATVAAQRNYDEVRRRFDDFQRAEGAGIQELRNQRASQMRILSDARERLAKQEALLRSGGTTNDAVSAARTDVAVAQAGVTGTDGQIAAKMSAIASRANDVRAAEERLKTLLDASQEYAEVKSTVNGRITLIHKRQGDMVQPAMSIASVDSSAAGTSLNVLAFIPARIGKRVQPGQLVRLSIAGAPSKEYGYLRGEVEEVKQYPVAPDYVERMLGERAFEESSYEVRVKLVQEDGHYVWMNGPGADDKVQSNTIVETVSVQIAEQKPFTLVIPWNDEDRQSVAERSVTKAPPGSN